MKLSSLLTILIALFSVSTSLAQGDIITAGDFMDLVKSNDNLIIVEASNTKTYKAAHIKNAIFIDHYDFYREDVDIPGVLKSADEMATFLGSQGIDENSSIVVYDEGSQKYSTRVYHILKYLGAKDVKILHKDLNEWRKARIPLTSTPATLKATTFTMDPQDNLVTTEYVADNKDREDVTLLDLRSADEYNGITNSNGHIPGAINIDYLDLLTDSGAFKPKEEIEAILANVGVNTDNEIIVSCRTGIKASVGYAALVNILGLENVKLYDASYLGWEEAQNELIK